MPEDTRVGTDVAGYRIESLIGRGGMGVVYLAEHLRLGRKVALKILAPELAENEKFRDRFLRESKVAASIDHPNIVPIYDADEFEGLLFIAMRYVEGTDLHDLIRAEGTLEPMRTASILEQIASALDAAHARGLVHRDVKPGNILLTSDDHVYLSDFGLTKRALSVSGLTQTGQLVGTIDYVAPEQIKGDPVDARADVYSLGCILYECLTGKVPYPRDMEVAVLWGHVQEDPPSVAAERPEMPEGLDVVVAHAMAKDPDERAPSAGRVATELRAALGLEAPTGVTLPRPKPAAKRHRRVVLIAGAGLALAAAIVGALLLTRGGGEETVVPPVNSVARIDAATHTFDAPTAVGENPIGVAVGEGSVWVINQADRTVTRIDPATGQSTSPKATGGIPTGIAFGEGEVWITTGYGGEAGTPQVVRLDPADGSLENFHDQPGAKAIVVAFGSIWLADENGGSVLRYDTSTGDLQKKIALGEGAAPGFLSVGTGKASGIWVADGLGGTVMRIDPEKNQIVGTFNVDSPWAVAANDDGLWVTSNANDSVTRFDPVTGTTIRTFTLRDDRVPNGPTTIAIAKDGVWVASDLDPVVVRIDPATNKVVDRLRVGGIVDGMAIDANGDVWVTVHAP